MYPSFDPTNKELTNFIFFTGKGGVGKTSTACSTAVTLADQGKKVLLVSTDPASNLQDVFSLKLENKPTEIPGVLGLYAANLDPEAAAHAYREKVIGPYRSKLPESVVANMEEQLSGACTVEIAAFDEFTNILADENYKKDYDHIIFDTAPTGHTLRLLSLPTAWDSFLEDSTHGASCLGPLSGLAEKKEIYSATVQILSNSALTTIILVSRPEVSALEEANRASTELLELGINNQRLLINGIHIHSVDDDPVSKSFVTKQQKALSHISDSLANIKTYQLPFVPYPLTGLGALRAFLSNEQFSIEEGETELHSLSNSSSLTDLIDLVSKKGKGVIMTMGKGGVGKTTTACAIAVGLRERGFKVHLTTTDPAAHLSHVLDHYDDMNQLNVSRIDPEQEVLKYRQEVLEKVSDTLDEDSLAYIKEDLESPCTEEIAVFRAFADVVEKADEEFVVIDTAPTGHTLLLLDATKSYHQELNRSTGDMPESVKKLLPRLRNQNETTVVLVTLAEATPVYEAARLQNDLLRAEIIPQYWIVNQSFYHTATTDPILKARGLAESKWISKVDKLSNGNWFLIPWQSAEINSKSNLKKLSESN